jgi:hypothetical protein
VQCPPLPDSPQMLRQLIPFLRQPVAAEDGHAPPPLGTPAWLAVPPLHPPMLGPLTPRDAELAGAFDRGGALRLEVQDPSRLADKRWYDGSIFNGLTKELSAWANIFCSDVLAVGQTRWHAYGPMVYGYLSGPPDEWPASLARRLEDRMARCQKVAFFCHTTAHWTLAVADPGSRLVRVRKGRIPVAACAVPSGHPTEMGQSA